MFYTASAVGSRSPGWGHYFAVDQDRAEGFKTGRFPGRCCRSGIITTGIGANGVVYYASEDYSIYRAVQITEIFPPVIDVSTSTNGKPDCGVATLQFKVSPGYLDVFYTTDGSIPSLESDRWDVWDPPLVVSGKVTAFAYHPSIGATEMVTRTFDCGPPLPPLIRQIDRPEVDGVEFRITSVVPGATIFYELNGNTPDLESALYDPENPPVVLCPDDLAGPVERELVAVAYMANVGFGSPAKSTYQFDLRPASIVGDVEFSRAGQEVALNVGKGTIHYTLDGAVPTKESPVYDGPIPAEQAGWIRTLTVREGFDSQAMDLGVAVRDFKMARARYTMGAGTVINGGDGIPAEQSEIRSPAALSVHVDGSIRILTRRGAFSDRQYLHTVSPEGMLRTHRLSFVAREPQYEDMAVLPNGDVVLARRSYPGVTILPAGNPDEQVVYGRSGRSESRDGTVESALFVDPHHVAVGSDGTIYVSDHDRIRTIKEGVVETIGGTGSRPIGEEVVALSDVQFQDLAALEPGPGGTLYIGDGSRVLRAGPDGMVSILAGGMESGHQDGAGSQARLQRVQRLAIDSRGACYVPADPFSSNDGNLQRIAPDGLVSTIRLPELNPAPGKFADLIVLQSGELLGASSDGILLMTLEDADGDGITDVDEQPPLLPGEDDLVVDSDADGISNAVEILLGTDPTSKQGNFRPSIVRRSTSELLVIVPTVAGERYQIMASEDLMKWRPVTIFSASAFEVTSQAVYPEKWRGERYYRILRASP